MFPVRAEIHLVWDLCLRWLPDAEGYTEFKLQSKIWAGARESVVTFEYVPSQKKMED